MAGRALRITSSVTGSIFIYLIPPTEIMI
jgi:hypothetical protein